MGEQLCERSAEGDAVGHGGSPLMVVECTVEGAVEVPHHCAQDLVIQLECPREDCVTGADEAAELLTARRVGGDEVRLLENASLRPRVPASSHGAGASPLRTNSTARRAFLKS